MPGLHKSYDKHHYDDDVYFCFAADQIGVSSFDYFFSKYTPHTQRVRGKEKQQQQ